MLVRCDEEQGKKMEIRRWSKTVVMVPIVERFGRGKGDLVCISEVVEIGSGDIIKRVTEGRRSDFKKDKLVV